MGEILRKHYFTNEEFIKAVEADAQRQREQLKKPIIGGQKKIVFRRKKKHGKKS